VGRGLTAFVTFKRSATELARRRASAEARPTSEATGSLRNRRSRFRRLGVGPQRRSPEGTFAEEDAARRSLPAAKQGKGPERRART